MCSENETIAEKNPLKCKSWNKEEHLCESSNLWTFQEERRIYPNALKKVQIDSVYIYLVLQIDESKFE